MVLSSIKARLIVLYTLIMFSVLSALSVGLFVSLKGIVYKPIDANLRQKALALDSLIDNSISSDLKLSFSDIRGNSFQLKISGSKLWVYSSQYSKYFFQIRSFDGKTIKKSISLGDKSLPFDGKGNYIKMLTVDNKVLRLFTYTDNKNKIIVQVAYNAKNEKDILDNFTLIVFLAIVFLMVVSAVSGFFISKKALKPINEISNDIKRISEYNLSGRIEIDDVPDELKDLISSFNEMLERLDRYFKQQKRFISDVSHELKTPISVIMMQSELALRKQRSAEDYKKALSAISNTSLMMSALVEKMLMLARLDSKNNKLNFEETAVYDVIMESINLLKHTADKKGVTIQFNGDNACKTKADRTMLLEVFINIIDNGVKYNKDNGRVDISIECRGEYIDVVVEDSGIGISNDDLHKITEEFYRVDESRSKKTTGFGLGLSIVKKIIDIHNGKIDITSKKDIGSKVAIQLKKI